MFQKTLFFLRKNLVFWDPMGRCWKHTPTKKHSTNGVQDGKHLCIDLLTILLNVWCRVGKQSQPRIDFGTKIQHNTSKNRLQEASRKWSSLGSITLFPNSFGVIPELVCSYSRTRLALFPNSFVLTSSGITPNEFGNKVNEFGNNAKRVRE